MVKINVFCPSISGWGVLSDSVMVRLYAYDSIEKLSNLLLLWILYKIPDIKHKWFF